jgi:hypothetical protein
MKRVLLAALFYLPSSAYLPLLGNAAFTLRPLCVAQERLRCDHDYPRWDGHTPESIATSPVLDAPASLIGSELPVYLAPAPSLRPVPMT